MPQNNPAGSNGHSNGTCPPDDILRTSLLQYSKERLSLDNRLRRLQDEHGYHIQLSTLKRLNKKFKIPSVRKPPPPEHAAQLVLEQVDADTNGLNGAGTVQATLAVQGHLIPRDFVRKIILDNVPEAVDARYPGQKKVKRTQLTAIGAFAEICWDGHAKGNAQALQMGPVSLPLYAGRCKWSGAALHMVVVPNERLPATVGHVFLDFVERYGAIPMKIVVDKGTETGEIFAMQTSLRRNYAPELSEDIHPPFVALKSTQNTTIEGLWHWLRKTGERNFLDEVKRGYNVGIFNPNDPVHVLLFYWLWPPICQGILDDFVEYWNCHKVRTQKNKLMPSGATPTDIFTSPQAYGGERCSIPVPQVAIDALRADLPVSREEALRFVDDKFAEKAEGIWRNLGSPALTVGNGWAVFEMMKSLL